MGYGGTNQGLKLGPQKQTASDTMLETLSSKSYYHVSVLSFTETNKFNNDEIYLWLSVVKRPSR